MQPPEGPRVTDEDALQAAHQDGVALLALLQGMDEGFALQELVLDDRGAAVDTRFLEVNLAFERLTGLRRAQVMGRLASEVASASPLWGVVHAAVGLTRAATETEAYCPRAGRPFRIRAHSPVPGQIAVFFRDITEPRAAQARLSAQERMQGTISGLFRSALDAPTEAELASTFLDAACRLTGSPVGFVGIINPLGNLQALAVIHDLMPTGARAQAEVLARMADIPLTGFWADVVRERRSLHRTAPDTLPGHPFPLERQLGTPLVQGHTILGFIGLANKRDPYADEELERMETLASIFVSALTHKRMELSLHDANADLEFRRVEMQAAIDELDAFSYTVSHDLRAPLRHIIGFTELLRKEMHAPPESRAAHFLETITASGRHMGSLIDALLVFSQSGRVPIQKQRVDLALMVPEVVRALELEAGDRKIAWDITNLPVVEADPVLIRSVLANLVSNAIKFTRERPDPAVRIGCESRDRETILFVADNGAGFNPRNAQRLFGVFQRLHPASRFEGTGIGLANVRRIILRHGGRVWATGEEGAGATFYFTLPCRPEA
ncbi:sensor histidine kinase [Mesoterricola sediminis]|uniref:histidine kinase n=1 Tax=Mesoterricola sediminis TaxID=2927980 RepID=A0AA48GQ09_9BACT|nr:ATP-binding protein [Mesoterricola sediminis]BDU77141.1 hypothetical protein METESE_20990 [Mesoterricola sediminis]